ncbi:VOC family protein [Paenarthrobacter sp. Z7-10]|uniref:VOC family protein n=1 Tax=Paenarthrobacter sp. Z7-10 TaxID=2787635 RepID=UPI0022A9013F|nr:VOC family protein [Paenarthrobacter sp. Z7-10]MCZ2401830.1 VOC family protein [Paenarthrobacter sp. Z7-10]
MPNVDSYSSGTPCWCDLVSSDVEGARQFYGSLFGWDFDGRAMGPDMTYYMATLNGRNVAGLMQQMPDMAAAGIPSVWNTYIAVDSVDSAAERITEAGGTLVFPPDEVPGSGRMVMATDTAGAYIGFWEGKGHIGASVVNEPGTVIWNELQVDDLAAALPFYQSVAGMDSDTGPSGDLSEYTQFLVNGKSIAGAMKKPMPDTPNNWTVYFNSADADQTAAKVQELGGAVIAPVFDVSGIGRMAVFTDPQGAVFCIMAAGSNGSEAAGAAGE